MRRRRKLEVSTFPFLAVLLCAMGSLILVLLAMDRKAKLAVKAKAELAARQVAEEAEVLATARRAEWTRARDEQRAAWERRRDELHAKVEADKRNLEGQMEALRARLAEVALRLQAEEGSVADLQRQAAMEKGQLEGLSKDLTERRAKAEASRAESVAARTALEKMADDLVLLETALQELKAARARERQTYSVVPYNGRRGENRRPLYVECATSGVVFHPDKATIDPDRAEEVRAEVQRRVARQRQVVQASGAAADDAPYLMLLVRPAGIAAYYQFQSALRGMDVRFGYEFIDADWLLDFPAEDAPATAQLWPNLAPTEGMPALASLEKPATAGNRTKGVPSRGVDAAFEGANFGSARGDARGRGGPAGLAANGTGTGGLTGAALVGPRRQGVAGIHAGGGDGVRVGANVAAVFGTGGGGGNGVGTGNATAGEPFEAGTGIGPTRDARHAEGTRPALSGNSDTTATGSPAGPPVGGTPAAGNRVSVIGTGALSGSSKSPNEWVGIGAAPPGNAGVPNGAAPLGSMGGTGPAASAVSGGTAVEGTAKETSAAILGTPGLIAGLNDKAGLAGLAPPGQSARAGQGGETAAGGTDGAPANGSEPAARQGNPSPLAGAMPRSPFREAGGRTVNSADAASTAANSVAPPPIGVGPGPSPDEKPPNTSAGKVGNGQRSGDSRSSVGAGKPASGQPGEPDGEPRDPLTRFAPQPVLNAPPRRPMPLRPARLTGDRDYVIYLECRPDGVVLYPSQRVFPVATLSRGGTGGNPLAQAVQQMIDRRQASVAPAAPPFRPQLCFLVGPESVRVYHAAYPALDAVAAPKTRQNLLPEDDVLAIVAGH